MMELCYSSKKIANNLVKQSLYSSYFQPIRLCPFILAVLLLPQMPIVVCLTLVAGNVPVTLADARWALDQVASTDRNGIRTNVNSDRPHHPTTTTTSSILSPHFSNELNVIKAGQNAAKSHPRRLKRGVPRQDGSIGLKDYQLLELHPDTHVYTNQFVLEANGSLEHVQQVARQHGFQYLAHIFDNYHHLEHRKIVKRSVDTFHAQHQIKIEDHPSVKSLQQQKLKRRVKRDYIEPLFTEIKVNPNNLPYYSSSHHRQYQQDNPPLLPFSKNTVINQSYFQFDHRAEFDDPQWPRMWYLNRGQGLDMNVEDAWVKNVTGKGIVVTILDDGLEKDHPDLYTNYDAMASYDVNSLDDDPMPRYDIIDSNRHGTRCAGEVAAYANNNVCAVGIAYNAKVGGIRMLDGDVTDAVEARSLSFNPQHVDIYSASWGPDDDGRTVDGPGDLAAQAFRNGILNGRNGKGSIFVWASGNGGREKDNCNCDGYTNSIWTLSISSATEKGYVPWYSEACPSTLATTYSSGSFGERQIVTTDLHHGCTASHTGTSASAPLAAGICALALEANPGLTWRDMQHIVVMTAKQKNLASRGEWRTNGVGRNVSHWFGYGLLDASAMVDLARDWVTVPDQASCEFRANNDNDNDTSSKGKSHSNINHYIGPSKNVTVLLRVNCSSLKFLEHVQSKINLTTHKRGDIEIHLTSPHNTTSILLAVRPMDNSRQGFANWPFMTVHTWGENPNGIWKLTIFNHGRTNHTYLMGWSLTMYGTQENPVHSKQVVQGPIKEIYSQEHAPINAPPVDVNNNNIDDLPEHGPPNHPKSSNNERNKIYVSSSDNNRNLSASLSSIPSLKGKGFDLGSSNVKQGLDDSSKDYDDVDTPGSDSKLNLAAGPGPYHSYVGQQHKHYQHSVDHQSNQYHKFYSPHQQEHHHRYPQMTSSSSSPHGPCLSPLSRHRILSSYLIISLVCAFAAIVL